jgi:hypothetical protein
VVVSGPTGDDRFSRIAWGMAGRGMIGAGCADRAGERAGSAISVVGEYRRSAGIAFPQQVNRDILVGFKCGCYIAAI